MPPREYNLIGTLDSNRTLFSEQWKCLVNEVAESNSKERKFPDYRNKEATQAKEIYLYHDALGTTETNRTELDHRSQGLIFKFIWENRRGCTELDWKEILN